MIPKATLAVRFKGMCGRVTNTKTKEELARHFGIAACRAKLSPNYNGAPTQLIPCVTNDDPKRISLLKWGFEPSWANRLLINAQSETASEIRTFSKALRERRCLVLVDGFYEWKRLGKTKTPLRFVMSSGEPFALAGLWYEPHDDDDERTFVILTTSANKLMSKIHDRMPVILKRSDAPKWLESGSVGLLKPFGAKGLKAYQVSDRVNSARNNDKSLIKAVKRS
jgi:putative SOS response-associated peptidase YedK